MIPQPEEHFVFKGWSDAYPTAIRRDENVEQAVSPIAQFERPTWNLHYVLGEGGKQQTGEFSQKVLCGLDGSAVEVAPIDADHYFMGWSDGVAEAKRIDREITGHSEFSARFHTYETLPSQLDFDGGTLTGGWMWRSLVDKAYCPWEFTDRLYGAKLSHGVALVADASMAEIGEEVNTAFYSPRYRLSTVDGNILVSFMYYRSVAKPSSSRFALEYTVDGTTWVELESLPEEVTGRINQSTLEATKLTPNGFVQFRWVYEASRRDRFVILDNISIAFEQAPATSYTISYKANPVGKAKFRVAGQLTTEQSVAVGELTRPVLVIPDEGYRFIGWSCGDTKNPYYSQLPIEKDAELVAELARTDQRLLSYRCVPSDGGKILRGTSGAQDEKLDASVTISDMRAEPAPGYRFVKWGHDGETDSQHPAFYPSRDTEVTALFERELIPVSVTVSAYGQPVDGITALIAETPVQTANGGKARLQVAPVKYVVAVPSALQYAAASKRIIVQNEEKVIQIPLEYAQTGHFVVSKAGEPVAGAILRLEGSGASAEGRSDAKGHCIILLPAGELSVEVEAPGCLPYSASLRVKPRTHAIEYVELTLGYALSLRKEGNGAAELRGAGGLLTNGALLAEGAAVEVFISKGKISSLEVDGMDVSASISGGSYRFDMPSHAVEVLARFAPDKPEAVEDMGTIFIQPNPCRDRLCVANAREVMQVELYSVSGHLLWRFATDGSATITLHLGALPAGTYLLRSVGQSQSRTERVLKVQ